LNAIDRHRDVIAQVRATIPGISSGAKLFQTPWQARVFALIVALVKEGHFFWTEFQSRLAVAIAEMEKGAENLDPHLVEGRYFECWLRAVEETLEHQGFITKAEIGHTIDDLRVSIAELKLSQRSDRQSH
jgi:nitrile hydratase accessory protein